MKVVGIVILVFIGIVTFPLPSRLAESPVAWLFAMISGLSFFGAYLLDRLRRKQAGNRQAEEK